MDAKSLKLVKEFFLPNEKFQLSDLRGFFFHFNNFSRFFPRVFFGYKSCGSFTEQFCFSGAIRNVRSHGANFLGKLNFSSFFDLFSPINSVSFLRARLLYFRNKCKCSMIYVDAVQANAPLELSGSSPEAFSEI